MQNWYDEDGSPNYRIIKIKKMSHLKEQNETVSATLTESNVFCLLSAGWESVRFRSCSCSMCNG